MKSSHISFSLSLFFFLSNTIPTIKLGAQLLCAVQALERGLARAVPVHAAVLLPAAGDRSNLRGGRGGGFVVVNDDDDDDDDDDDEGRNRRRRWQKGEKGKCKEADMLVGFFLFFFIVSLFILF